jgi:hypothetical protein
VVCGLTFALLLSTAGCAVLTRPHQPPASAGRALSAAAQAAEDGYTDYVGVIHIHTTYSHDAHGRFEDAIRVANAQQLDYLVFTEHNTLQPLREGKQGWHGMTYALIGMEISTRGGHYLALNVTEEIDRHKLTTQQVIDEVNRQGGLGFIAHPYFQKCRWKDWNVSGFTGIEAYNVAHDTLDENRLRLILWTLTAPADPFYFSILDRPYDPLAKWDALMQQHGRLTGIGAADAHEFRLAGITFAPYEVMFQLVRTHVLISSSTFTPEGFYEALRAGHAYLAVELVAQAKGFSFAAERKGKVVGIMGDELELAPDLTLVASLPAVAELALFRNGAVLEQHTAQTWEIPVTVPGIYRLEASRHSKPWIISNPIYVRPPARVIDSPTP